MADISMCLDHNCPSRNYCYRYTAIADKYRQSYADFKRPIYKDKCSHFWLAYSVEGRSFFCERIK